MPLTLCVNKFGLALVFILALWAGSTFFQSRGAFADVQRTSLAGRGMQYTNDNMGRAKMQHWQLEA